MTRHLLRAKAASLGNGDDINAVFLEYIGNRIAGLRAMAIIAGQPLPPHAQALVDTYTSLLPSLSSESAFTGLGIHSDDDIFEVSVSLPVQAVGQLNRRA